jgi:tetratricopeptide (TPR) repeat protein
MKYRALSSLFLMVAVSGCAYQNSVDLYLKGQQQADQGHIPDALASLNAAIQQNPRLSIAYLARASILQQQGNEEAAATDYEQVTALEPFNFKANFQLGVIYQHLKKFAQAVQAYQKAVDIRPLDSQANMNLALSYVQLGDPLQGVFYAERAVKYDESSATAHANLGVLYAQSQSHAKAIESFKRSLELDSHQPEVYLNLGQEYFSTSSYEQARNVLETARTLAPSARISERLGATYFRLKKFDKAEEAFRDAIKLDAKDTASLNGLGAAIMSQALSAPSGSVEMAKSAIAYWKQSLQLDGNQSAIQNLVNQYTPKE